ncbi:hypothetical protein [Kordiimonas aestuarii]|uniref:hypothetical protein n=1 Tax=Kordiimonas aestuarii TaxID=1005925 RepID=UPI0021CE218B|nr:hypothetical protein [Kordiimonas aestuarii]
MIKVTHIQKPIRVFAALIYIALQSASAVHATGHDADSPVDTSCMLCKFADHALAVAPGEAGVSLPLNEGSTEVPAYVAASYAVSRSRHVIRGPPEFS